ncbi:MAG: rhomboid family intramembrane serine protease [Flavobacteriaceae bacterium]|nr:rhomboid family intramembrane serine protease [Flavobacteriaceae bacterium]
MIDEKSNTKFWKYPLFFVLLIWLVYWVEVTFGFNFAHFGIRPLKFTGLKGILFSPWIHSGIEHLYHNTIPLFVLSSALAFFYRDHFWKVIIVGILGTGIITWLIGRPSFHIGASGLIYVLASFLFFKGIIAFHFRLIAISLSVVFYYGSMIWYLFPVEDGVSWEGHLSGAIIGVLLAFFVQIKVDKSPKYEWQKDDFDENSDLFMSHFDENGKFIPNRFDQIIEDNIIYEYHYKPTEEE